MAVSFDGENRVDQMLERSWACEGALLRHVADEHHGCADGPERGPTSISAAGSDLGEAPRWAGDVAERHRLYRVDHHQVGAGGGDRIDDLDGVGSRQHQQPVGKRTETLRTKSHLLGGLLGRRRAGRAPPCSPSTCSDLE